MALLKRMAMGADHYCSLFWLVRGFYWTADPHRPASFFAVQQQQPATEPRTLTIGALELAYGSGDFDAPELQLRWPIRLFYRLAHQLTTVQGPKVVDNYHHVWLDDDARAAALRFRQGLWDYRAGQDQRNAARELVFNAFDPTVIETSVQT